MSPTLAPAVSIPGTGGAAAAATAPVRPALNAPFHPHGDTATFRDLLLFEERLKMNAEMLRRRRRRYMVFLWSFVLAFMVMAHRLVFTPPRTLIYFRALQGCLAVVLITLVLFFASGMYEEKIRYAHSYLTHSNKALRPINMHLNTRRPPLTSSLASYLPSILRPAAPVSPTPTSSPALASGTIGKPSQPSKPTTTITPSGPNSFTLSPTPPPSSAGSLGGRRVSTTLPSIPPSSNPRGELIFSSRVDRGFREGYERYRAAFERRREEKARREKEARGPAGVGAVLNWRRRGSGSGSGSVDFGPGGSGTGGTMTPTPPHSRRNTPPPGIALGGTGTGEKEGRGGRRTPSPHSSLRFERPSGTTNGHTYSGSLGRHSGSGVSGEVSTAGGGEGGRNRERAESYSFAWTGNRDEGPLRRAP